MSLKNRFPSWSEIFPVYSVIVFWSYTYGLLVLMFNLPSWILMVPLGEILGYFSYGMAASFLDSLLFLGTALGLAFILPGAWFRDDFAASGSVAAGLLFFWVALIQLAFSVLMDLPVLQFLLFYLCHLRQETVHSLALCCIYVGLFL